MDVQRESIAIVIIFLCSLLGNGFLSYDVSAAPNTPNTPNPADGAPNVSRITTLSWIGGSAPERNETIVYDVYFGADSEPPEVSPNQAETTYDPGMLSYNTTYFWKIIAWNNYNESAEGPLWHFTTLRNNPPVFGPPSPANGSTNTTLGFDWSTPINDTEGDLISWTIECSNGDANSGTNESNGTKTLSFAYLSYNRFYTVWVNATDPLGSGMYTRRWYIFQTKPNLPPVFGIPTPSNGSMDNALDLTWSIPINDPDGDPFTWTIECNNGQSNGSEVASDGTKSIFLSGLAYSIVYTVWVNATDLHGRGLAARWYTFQTMLNLPLVFGTSTPSNGSMDNALDLTWSIPINDPDGDPFTWTIQCDNGQTAGSVNASNGTKSIPLLGLAYAKVYTVWVNATDPTGSGIFTRAQYTFTTQNAPINNPPLLSNASPTNASTNIAIGITNLSIMIQDPEGAPFDWFITTSPDLGNSSGTGATNGTKTCNVSGLSYGTHYTWTVCAYDGMLWTNQSFFFTTVSYYGGGGEMSPPPQTNHPPIADASAGEPYHGDVGTTITFNGSKSYDPDGNITTWLWDFGDSTNGTGKATSHAYTKAGVYNVTLTVTDDDGATGIDTALCIVTQPNVTPTRPIIIGPVNGTKYTDYIFTVVSMDSDHDALCYTFTWGDGITTTTRFFPEETPVTQSHRWSAPGRYLITVKANDNHTDSALNETSIFIDVMFINDSIEGYLIDSNGDGTYELFNNTQTGIITTVIRGSDGSYLIDSNGDNKPDYKLDNNNKLLKLPPEDIPQYATDIVVVTAGGLLFLGAAYVGITETGKYRFFAWLFSFGPLFTRIQRDEALNQEMRGNIYDYIESNPGAHYNSIMKNLGVGNGTLSHHLNMLEKMNIVKSRREGIRYRVFYVTDIQFPAKEQYHFTELQARIVEKIKQNDGILQTELIASLGLKQQTVNYNIKKLERNGVIRVERRGGRTYCYYIHERKEVK
jgi:DNA-binding MarR family transcriptional regulator/PKD repeat protein